VRPVPVGYVGFCVPRGAREQRKERAWGENAKPFAGIVVYESLEVERDGREGIDKADELPRDFQKVRFLYAQEKLTMYQKKGLCTIGTGSMVSRRHWVSGLLPGLRGYPTYSAMTVI